MDRLKTLHIAPVQQCASVQSMPLNPDSFLTSIYTPTPAEKIRASEKSLEALAKALAEDQQTHEANAEALGNNLLIVGTVRQLMRQIGIPERWGEMAKQGRSRTPKYVTHPAGFEEDLGRHVVIDDGFQRAQDVYQRLKDGYTRYGEQARRELELAERRAAQEEQARQWQREATMALATIFVRYGFDVMTTWESVLETLRQRDQRLDLAVAMEQTRGDWSDGYERVHEALARFTPKTDADADIARDVAAQADDTDWGYDGRVFRDMEPWNYEAIYASITDQQLVADARTALRYI